MQNDAFGFIAYGENETYHRGALFGALRLLHFCPGANILVATDKPDFLAGYPVEIVSLAGEQKDRMSFGGRYHFGIKAGCLIELLQRVERLIFMDTDMYPVGDPSKGFGQIAPSHSFMRLCEGPHRIYQRALPGKNISIGGRVLTGQEPMWNSGIVGVHRSNLDAMRDAYGSILAVREATDTWAPEQFCLGVALSQAGRTVSPHRLPIRNYNTRGKKLFAGPRLHAFFAEHGHKPVATQIASAARFRLWRTPFDLWKQRHVRAEGIRRMEAHID